MINEISVTETNKYVFGGECVWSRQHRTELHVFKLSEKTGYGKEEKNVITSSVFSRNVTMQRHVELIRLWY